MASDAAPVAESSSPVNPDNDQPKPESSDANPQQAAESKSPPPPQAPVDNKPAPNKDKNVNNDTKQQDKKPAEKTPAAKPDSAKAVVYGDQRMQQLMTLWTQFQKAEQQHTSRIRDMEERLQRAEKTVEHFGKFCGEYHLLWKVKDFRRCYEEGATQAREVMYSPAFDTHRNGYKLQLNICPAGDGKGRGVAMSVFFAILKGPYDSLLSWPFTCPVTITLLDQMSGRDPEHPGPPRDIARTFTPNPRPENEPFLGRPAENRNICLGFPKFVPLKELFDGRFICDDAIYFKVHVDISRLQQQQQQQQA